MLVDDEVSLARLGYDLLAYRSYAVVSTTRSQEALHLFRATPDAFDLVITDQTVPELTGEALAKALRQIRPDMPIILCIGFSQGITAESAHALGIDALCMQPFHVSDLAATIHQVLAQRT